LNSCSNLINHCQGSSEKASPFILLEQESSHYGCFPAFWHKGCCHYAVKVAASFRWAITGCFHWLRAARQLWLTHFLYPVMNVTGQSD
jgi:hypothetical protein